MYLCKTDFELEIEYFDSFRKNHLFVLITLRICCTCMGVCEKIVDNEYTPGFFANTDSKYDFDRQFCRAYQMNSKLFSLCEIWAKSPTKPEFYEINNAYTKLPDFWGPYCPSCITKKDISM